MRAYDETITWLNFRLDLRPAPPSFWILLGECVAGIRSLIRTPLPESEGKDLEQEIMAKALHGRLVQDGLPLSWEQVMEHLSGQLPRNRTQEKLLLELDGLLHVWRSIAAKGAEQPTLDPDLIRTYHEGILANGSAGQDKGRWRTGQAGPRALDGVPSEVVPVFMVELCDWLNGPELAAPAQEDRMAYALLHALIAELYLRWITPFSTAGQRINSVLMQHILTAAGLGSIPGHLLSAHLHRHQQECQRQLENAATGVPDPIPFLAFALRGLQDGLLDLRSRTKVVQAQGQWRAHLSDLFRGKEAAPSKRQEQLLLDLAQQDGPVPLTDIPTLSPVLARMYAEVSEKTLRRDIDSLENLGSILRGPNGIRVRLERLLAFRY